MKEKMSMVCDKCHLIMPVDSEKSNKNWTVFKNKCSCGSDKSTPVFHQEGVAPTKEALEHFINVTKEPVNV